MIYKEEIIMSSDDDCPIMSYITIGETKLGELALCLEDHYSGDDDDLSLGPDDLAKVVAVIDNDDLSAMAKHIGIPAHKVRDYLFEKFYDGGFISRRAYIRESFQEILNFILDNEGKYSFLEKG